MPAETWGIHRVAVDDKVFVRRDDGTVSLFNQNMVAMRIAMDAFAGAAAEAGIASEDDLSSVVREARAEMSEVKRVVRHDKESGRSLAPSGRS